MIIKQIVRDFNLDSWGGIEQVVLNYNRILKEKGYLNSILTWDINKTKKHIYSEWGMNVSQISPLPPHIKNYDFDLLHWHSMYPGLCWMAPYLKKKNIPIIMSLHTPSTPRELDLFLKGRSSRFWSMRKLGRMWMVPRLKNLLPQIKTFICHSKEHIDLISKYFPDHQVEYIPNGVDIKHFSEGDGTLFRKTYNIPMDSFMILSVGRIDPVKKQHLLIELMHEMLRIRPNSHLVFIGPPEYPKYAFYLQSKIKKLGLEKHVTIIPGFNPKDKSLIDAYHACDLFMLPRTDEVFGIVLLEAFSASKCVIASRSGGVPAVVTEGVTGLLHKPDDKVDMLACFEKVALNDNYRISLGRTAREQVYQNFSWDVVGNKLIDLYENVLECKTKNVKRFN